MAISTADFKNGMCIVNNGKMCTIVEFQHVKPGKGGAFVRTKLRDIKTGRVVDYTFNAGTKFDTVRLETRKMQYLYNDGSDFYFMDPNTYDQMSMPAETVGDTAKWLKENDEASLLYAGEKLISIEPQMFVELECTHTEPGFKGDTATNTTKPATFETGVELQVPTFVEIGDVLQIDTRDCAAEAWQKTPAEAGIRPCWASRSMNQESSSATISPNAPVQGAFAVFGAVPSSVRGSPPYVRIIETAGLAKRAAWAAFLFLAREFAVCARYRRRHLL